MSSMVITKTFCSTIMSIAGLEVVRSISGTNTKLTTLRTITLMALLIIIPVIIHGVEYSYAESLIAFIITIITYKEILNISIINSTICCCIFHLFIILLEFIGSLILVPFLTAEFIRSTPFVNIAINIIFAMTSIIVFRKTKLSNFLPLFIHKIETKNKTRIIIFFILAIIALSIVLYYLSQDYRISDLFTRNFSVFIIFFLLIIILFSERNDYEKLSNEYDNLFKYVQIFEDWIENEQLTRHEYKNQLVVLRSITKEKKVKNKIDSIVEDFINIDNHMISQLKSIPNGGLKGLLYYKIAIATKDKVEITIDVDEKTGELLSKIRDERLKDLSKLLGIYLDNAIEAAKETRKKLVTIEIYEIKGNIKIVISNSFRNNINISNRYQKGISTKGDGRGNGLYFANKLISKNIWIQEEQEIVNDFYIQQLLINIKK